MGFKTRGNYAIGAKKCFSWCKCIQCRKKKKKRATKKIKPFPFDTQYLKDDKETP